MEVVFDIEDFSIDNGARLQEIEALTKNSLVDLSGYKFDRDSANNH